MTIYSTNKTTAYTCVMGEDGSDIVSVFIDKATTDTGDTTYEMVEEDGGITITTTKGFAKDIALSFAAASVEG